MDIYEDRIESLRLLMAQNGIDHYLVVTEDSHGSEYVSDHFKCREFLSGFTGSAGTLLVSKDRALLWTDGRYFLQAEEELSGSGIELMRAGTPGTPALEAYLTDNVKAGETLGYDGRTVSYDAGRKLREAMLTAGGSVRNDLDLTDELWADRPPLPANPVWTLDPEIAGKTRREKLAELREAVEGPVLVTAPDEIAWLCNIRGDDVLYTPVALAYAVVTGDSAVLYIAPEAVSDDVRQELEADGITLKPYMDIYEDVRGRYGAAGSPRLQMDGRTANEALALRAASPVFRESPLVLAKAVKNGMEIQGERIAHLKDGVALTKVICRLKKLAAEDRHAELTELGVSEMILHARMEQENFISPSFESIVATGEHGAIIHYAPSEESDRPLEDGFLLLDTGGHYLEGTTDVTRTLVMGTVSEEEKRIYTAVLKGHLALTAADFPEGTAGNALDVLARAPLWEMGIDYDHGTGHGVGFILSVHEGPNSISKRGPGTPLAPGTITSNEPGAYIPGRFGIRLENLLLCRETDRFFEGRRFLEFVPLTLVPFDRDAIVPGMLSRAQLKRLNEYHAYVRDRLTPFLDEEEAAWLEAATAEICL